MNRQLSTADSEGARPPFAGADERQWEVSPGRPGGPHVSPLPVLTTAGDIREFLDYMRKKPRGVVVAEEINGVKKRVFESRKLAAFDSLGLTEADGDLLTLSLQGREFAEKLQAEVQIFRRLLNQTGPYHSVLEWVADQELDVVTIGDVSAMLLKHHPDALSPAGDDSVRGAAVSFFHLCQAAGLGTMTLGKRGHCTRLCVDRDELASYLQRELTPASDAASGTSGEGVVSRGTPSGPFPILLKPVARRLKDAPLRALVCAGGKGAKMIGQVAAAFALGRVECQLLERDSTDGGLTLREMLPAMRLSDAGFIAVSDEDCVEAGDGTLVLKERVVLEIEAALVLFGGRVALLLERGLQIPPDDFPEAIRCEFDGGELTLEEGLHLITIARTFEKMLKT